VRQTPAIRGGKALYFKLQEAREMAFLSKRLATVARDAPLPAGFADLAGLFYAGADRAAVEALCLRLGFKSLPKRIERWRSADPAGTTTDAR
jgi:5'-3' exonuclease